MDTYDPRTVFSSIDRNGRYAYANQPAILTWNLTRLAETLLPLVDEDKDKSTELLTEALQAVHPLYQKYSLQGMRAKIGLSTEDPGDQDLVNDLLWVMQDGQADFTLFFRRLSQAVKGESDAVRNLLEQDGAYGVWAKRWQKRLGQEGVPAEKIAMAMDKVNPIYIPRNHKVEEALSAATATEDIKPFTDLLNVITHPYDEDPGNVAYTQPAPETDTPYKTFCGT
jgi:uncharacterized protein YdiU (UPF0061 family)